MRSKLIITIQPHPIADKYQTYDLTSYLSDEFMIGDIYSVQHDDSITIESIADTSFSFRNSNTSNTLIVVFDVEKVPKRKSIIQTESSQFTLTTIETTIQDFVTLEFTPDDTYQRQTSWFPYQQKEFLKNIFTTSNIPEIHITTYTYIKRGKIQTSIIDGLMRYDTMKSFLNGTIALDGLPLDKTNDIMFALLSLSDKEHFRKTPVYIHNYEHNGDIMPVEERFERYLNAQDHTKPSSAHLKKIKEKLERIKP